MGPVGGGRGAPGGGAHPGSDRCGRGGRTACSGGLGLGVLEWVDGGGVAGVGKVVVLVHRPRGSAERAGLGWGFGAAPR